MPPKQQPTSRKTPTSRTPAKPVTGPNRGAGSRQQQQAASGRGRTSVAASSRQGAGTGVGKRPVGPAATGGRGQQTVGRGGKTPLATSGKPGQATAKTTPKKPVWTKEDDMARKIQSYYRSYRCRKMLSALKKKQQEYDDLMAKLEKEAFLQIVQMEREKDERERKQAEEERRKRKEELQRIKRMLDASFDGDNDEIKSVLKEVAQAHTAAGTVPAIARHQFRLIECKDANNNTPLSEASAGGHPSTVELLISLGGDLNYKAQYGRTPLYRAAFGGHFEAAKALLEHGADPRIHADDGAIPEHVASRPEIEALFKEWDVEVTEQLLVKLEKEKESRVEEENKMWVAEEDKAKSMIDEAEKEHQAMQKQLKNAHQELNKRIYEHDKPKNLKKDLTLKAIKDAEVYLDECRVKAESAKEKLEQARLKMRMKRKEYDIGDDEEEQVEADLVVVVKELDEVLMKDVGNKIAQSGKWPLIVDIGRQCTTFLRYRDTNYLNTLNPRDMEPDAIRMALLGAIRFGKFLVLDLMNVEDIWVAVSHKFDQVQSGLLAGIMDHTFFKEERYLKLLKSGDGEQYSQSQFIMARVDQFRLVILTQLTHPPQEITEQCYIIRIHTPQPTLH